MPIQDHKITSINVDKTVSTNVLAKEILKEQRDTLPFVVQSNFQVSGKGQLEKIWESEPNQNLLMSLVVKAPKININQQFLISKAISVAIRSVLSKNIDKVYIKWPNDIYVKNKKIAGVLIENSIIGTKLETCIIGIGLNINQIAFSDKVPNPTSYKIITNKTFDIETIKQDIINSILESLDNLQENSEIFEKHLYRKGELEQFKSKKDGLFFGVILGTNELGQLLVRVENHKVKTFSNNEIEFIQRNKELC